MQDMNNKDINNNIVEELLSDRRKDRFWKNIRFMAWFVLFAYVIFAIFYYFGDSQVKNADLKGKYVSLIRLNGMIASERDFSAETVVPLLHDAFADKDAAGVILDINSPGGSPVQAAIIHDAILTFKKKYHKRVVIVGEDLLTSGAYYVAVAGDSIYVNPNTLTGSIGVVMKGFGFVELLKKIGVERRVYVTGNDKDRLDPFLPQSPADTKKIQEVMEEVHQNFSQAVLAGRKGKLNADPSVLFTGDFWSGQSALKLGLVDHLGNFMDAMDKEFQATKYKEYGETSDFLRLLGGQLGSTFDSMIGA